LTYFGIPSAISATVNSASKMTYIVSGGALNSTHSLTRHSELYGVVIQIT